MRPRLYLTACLSLAAVALGAGGGETGKDYLTKDGSLTQPLVVRDVQGGFAGFTGKEWRVEPAGTWSVHRVRNKPIEVEGRGELTKEQLAALAAELARYGVKDLPSKKPGQGMANPHVVTVTFGKRSATLTLKAGEALPEPDPKTVEGRYAGIVRAVAKLLAVKKKADGKRD